MANGNIGNVGFEDGESNWIVRLGNLRNTIRQEVIARQIAGLARFGMTVLDVGCGQGTQAVRLASAGCQVTGIDPSDELLELCSASAASEGLDIELLKGRLDDLGELVSNRTFDLVCCHGVMMYLHDRVRPLALLGDRVASDGHLSVTFRNGHALAMRPGLRGDWDAALSAFGSSEYVNELGVAAMADRIDEIEQALSLAGLSMSSCYGVRVFNDAISVDTDPPEHGELVKLLDAEEIAGRTEPYKWMASQLHVIAQPR